jgi:hypothetical protein
MKRLLNATLIAGMLAAAPWAEAQSNEELLQELRALKERVTQLEEALKAREAKEAKEASDAKAAPAKPAVPLAPSGMTPQQVQDLNRVSVKAEMIEDAFEGFRGLRISGQVDPTYIYNHAQGRGGFQFLGPIRDDGYHYDSSYFGMAVIDLQKELDNGIRFHLALAPNRGAGSTIDSGRSIVHEASVTIPLADSQTRLLAGQLPSWSGYEAALPNQNRLITHNLLFDFTQPRALTGIGAEWVAGQWILKGMVANIDEGFRPSGQKTPVIAYRADWAKGEYRGYGFAGVHGKAPNRVNGGTNGASDSMLNLFEIDGYYNGPGWVAQGQLTLGTQTGGAVTPNPTTGALRDSRWWGVSGLFAYRLMPRLDAIVRADYLNNSGNGGGLYGSGADARDGFGPEMIGRGADGRLLLRNPDLGASRYALAVGLNYVFNANVSFKAEYRLDHATLPVFEVVNDGSFRRSNHLLGASMVLSF